MMVLEPENPYDEFAIVVKTLDGSSLGYVPRTENQEETFMVLSKTGQGAVNTLRGGLLGHVLSTGPAMFSRPLLFGATVSNSTSYGASHKPTDYSGQGMTAGLIISDATQNASDLCVTSRCMRLGRKVYFLQVQFIFSNEKLTSSSECLCVP